MKLELDDAHIESVFEILCEVPFEILPTITLNPPTTRDEGIEQLIEQPAPIYDKLKGEYNEERSTN